MIKLERTIQIGKLMPLKDVLITLYNDTKELDYWTNNLRDFIDLMEILKNCKRTPQGETYIQFGPLTVWFGQTDDKETK